MAPLNVYFTAYLMLHLLLYTVANGRVEIMLRTAGKIELMLNRVITTTNTNSRQFMQMILSIAQHLRKWRKNVKLNREN